MQAYLQRSVKFYWDSFQGFSKEVWWLALATLVNRAGAMVLPFLTLYLTASLNFSMPQVGWIMSSYGLGSLVGAWLGGEFTHRIGAYKTMIISMLGAGIAFVSLGYLNSYLGISIGIFIAALVSDIFRPAVFVSLAAYARPENRTRAVTLIRLAINLGFSIGPAFGGLIIVLSGYNSLFWIDGITSAMAGLLILVGLPEKLATGNKIDNSSVHGHRRILSDSTYLWFLLATFLFSMLFVQYFSAMPVYYKTEHLLSEDNVGWILSLNGFLIFLTEMPIIFGLDKPEYSKFKIIVLGSILLAASYGVLLLTSWSGVLVIGMIMATLAEMLCFPFTNTIALSRGGSGNEGRYMAYYSMTFSLAHIVGHNFGMQISNALGFNNLFVIMMLLATLAAGVFWWVSTRMK